MQKQLKPVYFFSQFGAFNFSLECLECWKEVLFNSPAEQTVALALAARGGGVKVVFFDESLQRSTRKRLPLVIILMLRPHVLINAGNKAHIQLLLGQMGPLQKKQENIL